MTDIMKLFDSTCGPVRPADAAAASPDSGPAPDSGQVDGPGAQDPDGTEPSEGDAAAMFQQATGCPPGVARRIAADPVARAEAVAGSEIWNEVPSVKTLKLHPIDMVRPRPVDWLWPGRFALGKLSLIGGPAGAGKSNLLTYLVAAVSTGGAWPCGEGRAPLGTAVMFSAEDDAFDTTIPRLQAAGADLARIRLAGGVYDLHVQGRRVDLWRDASLLGETLENLGDVKLITIDPIASYLDGRESTSNAAMRKLLARLSMVADTVGAALIGVVHSPKRSSTNPSDHFIGSIALGAVARSAFLIRRDPTNADRALMLQVKNNLATQTPTLAFRLEARTTSSGLTAPAVAWESEPVAMDVHDVLAMRSERGSQCEEAEEFLRDLLTDPQGVLVQDIEHAARAAGLLRPGQTIGQCKPLRVARAGLGVGVAREGFGPGAKYRWRIERPPV